MIFSVEGPEDIPEARTIDPTYDRVKMEVIQTVVVHANKEPTELPPLTETVDPGALDAIFAPRPDDTPRSSGTVVFPYAGCRVRITANQDVEVVTD